jgi:multidrug efflux pump subunit AcrA (membrane-fusion protein)
VFRTILYLSLVTAIALAGCAGQAQTSATSEGVVSSVTVTDKIETSGNLSAGQLVQLTWGTGGLIENVNVKVGDKVKEGAILASLKADSVTTDMITAQATLATAQRDLEDLQDASVSQAEAQQNVLNAREALETAQNNLDGLAYPRASDALIKNTQAKIWDAQRTLTWAYKQYKEVQHNPDGDPQKTAMQLAMTNAQLSLNQLVATYNWYTMKATQADYDSAKAALELARANFEAAKRKRDIVKNGADPLALAAAKAKVAAAQSQVNGILTIAPFDGEILAVQAVAGNAVAKGDNSVAMVDRNTLKIDTQIDESSISSVAIGNKVEITMDSLPGVVLNGKVTLINPIGSTVSGLVKYTVSIAVEPTSKPLLFGATANIVIITGEPHSSLAVPVNAVNNDSRGEYVLVIKADGTTQRVEVTSGDLVESLVTISPQGSLAEGDHVELGASSSAASSSSSSNNRQQQAPGGGGIIVPGPGGPGG